MLKRSVVFALILALRFCNQSALSETGEAKFPREDGVYRKAFHSSVPGVTEIDYHYYIFRGDKVYEAEGQFAAPDSYRLKEPDSELRLGGIYDGGYFAEEAPLEDHARLLMMWVDEIYPDSFTTRPVLDRLDSGGVVIYKETEQREATKTSQAYESYVSKALLPTDAGLVSRLQTTFSNSDEVLRHSNDLYTFIPAEPQAGAQRETIQGSDIRQIVEKAVQRAHQKDNVKASIAQIQSIEMKMGITAQLTGETGRAADLPYATGLRGLDRQLAASRLAASRVFVAEEMQSYYQQLSLARRTYERAVQAHVWDQLTAEQRDQAVEARLLKRPVKIAAGELIGTEQGENRFVVGRPGFYLQFPAAPRRRFIEYEGDAFTFVAEHEGMVFRGFWGTMEPLREEIVRKFSGLATIPDERLIQRKIEDMFRLESTKGIKISSAGRFGQDKQLRFKNELLQVQAKTFMTLSGGAINTRLAIWSVVGAPADAEATELANQFMNSVTSKHPHQVKEK